MNEFGVAREVEAVNEIGAEREIEVGKEKKTDREKKKKLKKVLFYIYSGTLHFYFLLFCIYINLYYSFAEVPVDPPLCDLESETGTAEDGEVVDSADNKIYESTASLEENTDGNVSPEEEKPPELPPLDQYLNM